MDDLIKLGVIAFKAGNIETARKLLTDAVKLLPDDDRAWGWLYNVSVNNQDRISCLTQMLRINPNNEKANGLLRTLTRTEDFDPLEDPLSQAPEIQPVQIPIVQKCHSCGENIKGGDIFCGSCGAGLEGLKQVLDNQRKAEIGKKLAFIERDLYKLENEISDLEVELAKSKKGRGNVGLMMVVGVLLTPVLIGFVLIVMGIVASITLPKQIAEKEDLLDEYEAKVERLIEKQAKLKAELAELQ